MSEAVKNAASSFDLGDVDLSNPASFYNAEIPAVKETAPRQMKESNDVFFNSEEVGLEGSTPVESPEQPEASSQPVEGSNSGVNSEVQQAFAEVSIDAFKKDHKFILNPEDATLRRTLRNGVKAPKLKADLDKANAKLAEFQTPEVQEKIKVWDELKGFASSGDYDKVFQSILGDQYSTFLEMKLNERLEYEEADPGRRAEIDLERYKRDQSYKERQKDKELQSLRAEAEARVQAATLDQWAGYAVPAIEKFGFNATEVADKDQRYQLNKELWNSSWDAINRYADGDQSKITPQVTQKAFKQKASLLKYGSTKPAQQRFEELASKKQAEAARTAASVATSNYPTPTKKEDRLAGWTSGKAVDLLKFLR